MKTLYVHIGTPKTGTTAIQRFCSYNQENLEKHGYCYPDFRDLYPGFTPTRNGHFLADSKQDTVENGKFCEGMNRTIALFEQFENIILSDEILWRVTYNQRKDLWNILYNEGEKNGFQVKIIVYLRRQDDFLISSWKQTVKKNVGRTSKMNWQEYADNILPERQLDYYKKLESIAEILGKENILVRRFARGNFVGGNIYADFMQAIGLELTDEFSINEPVTNISLSENTAEIKRILNNIPNLDDEKNNSFMNILLECTKTAGDRPSYSMFSEEETLKLLEKYQDGNLAIAREYLHEDNSELFDTTIKTRPKWQTENPYMHEDIIRFVGLCYMHLMDENTKLKHEIYNLKHPFKTIFKKIFRKTKA